MKSPVLQNGRLPNFLVIGGAKAGSTSMYNYLAQHPDIFMSPVKEIRFFGNDDNKLRKKAGNLDEYCAFFKEATTQTAVGEVSPQYLYWSDAANEIKELIPDAKLIAILRDPSERAYSHFIFTYFSNRLRHNINEPQLLQLEDYGKLIRRLPRSLHLPLPEEANLLELRPSFYADDLQSYFSLFEREQIKILLYEDLKDCPIETMQDIFDFLGVDSSFVSDVNRRHNPTMIPKHDWLESLLVSSNFLKKIANQIVPDRVSKGLARLIMQYNKKDYQPLTKKDKAWLIEIFREDILQTQKLIERDLSHWLQ